MKSSILALLLLYAPFCFSQINWDTPMDVSASSSYGNNYPRIVMTGMDTPVVSWSDGDNMFLARWNGSSFDTPQMVNPGSVTTAGQSWMGPDIASKGDTLYAVYKQTPEIQTTSYVWCVSSFDGGATLNTPVRVDFIADSVSRFPTVTVDQNGNPIVAFMKFDAILNEARWVVARSNDMGQSFNIDVKASGWSAPLAEVCDCCPGQIVNDGNNTVAMLYRDNNSNIRDTWVGISTDNGNSFTSGMGVDQQNWVINSCPSSGPDGFIVGDTLFTTYMSSASGNTRVYYNKSSISAGTGSPAIALDQSAAGLVTQNYPRTDYYGGSAAIVYQQFANGLVELGFEFTENVSAGMNQSQQIVDSDWVSHPDVVLGNGVVFIVWQDDQTGTVKYLRGDVNSTSSIADVQLNTEKEIVGVYDVMGRQTSFKSNSILIVLYSDGSTQRVFQSND